MIASSTSFALLLLSLQACRQVHGEHTVTTKTENGSSRTAVSTAETRIVTGLRLPRKEIHADLSSTLLTRSMKEDDVETDWPTYTPTDFKDTSTEFITTSNEESGYMRDPTSDETISVSMDTPWPTYFPTSFATRAPSIDTPIAFGVSSSTYNCNPIGSRGSSNNHVDKPTPENNSTPRPVATTLSETPVLADPTPTSSPTTLPTPHPTSEEHHDSIVTFRRGDMLKNIERLGIKVSKGVTVRVLAKANVKVNYSNGKKSELPFHRSPDGASIIPLENGGYVYVSNSEASNGNGGVYGLYFDHDGKVLEYKSLLNGTTMSCSGGTTPWKTVISCEEYEKGQCWQVDPDPASKHHAHPEPTKLGGTGGFYEAVACDDRNKARPTFFVTEDHITGALRKYTPPPPPMENNMTAGWESLHLDGGTTEYLVFHEENKKFTWSSDESLGRTSQSNHYPNVEGINYHEGMLYFVSKKTLKLYVLDLDNMNYTSSSTNDYTLYSGVFKHSPDQLVRDGKYLYFTEDGGKTPGVYAIDADGNSFSIFEAYDEKYFRDETTGLSFSPDGKIMYACFQDCGCSLSGSIDCGCLLSFWRDDGLSFDGATMPLKFHAQK